jgi:hypothetical protein
VTRRHHHSKLAPMPRTSYGFRCHSHSPLQPTYVKATIADPTVAMEGAAELKYKKCKAACEKKDLAFVPLPVSTFGAAEDHIRDNARLQASRSGHSFAITAKHVFERLSVLLQRGNAGMLFARSPLSSLPAHIVGTR